MAESRSSSDHSPSDDEKAFPKSIEGKAAVVATSDGEILKDPDAELSEGEQHAAVCSILKPKDGSLSADARYRKRSCCGNSISNLFHG